MPLVDMANHDPQAYNCEVRRSGSGGGASSSSANSSSASSSNGSGGTIEMVAVRPIKAGQPVTINYGTAMDNHHLLLSYGFVLPGNAHNSFALRLGAPTLVDLTPHFVKGLPEGWAPAPWRLQALAALGLPMPAAEQAGENDEGSMGDALGTVLVRLGGSWQSEEGRPALDPRLLTAARLLLLPQEALPAEARQPRQPELPGAGGDAGAAHSGGGDPPMPFWAEQLGMPGVALGGAAAELQVLDLLIGLCTAVYHSFPTSIQQDKAILAAAAATQALSASGSSSPPSSSAAGDRAAAAQALLVEADMQQAVQFRLEQKRALEAALKSLLHAAKALKAG